jgi:hypothetical protein
MVAAIGTTATAASLATLPFIWLQKCHLSLKIQIKNEKLGSINC